MSIVKPWYRWYRRKRRRLGAGGVPWYRLYHDKRRRNVEEPFATFDSADATQSTTVRLDVGAVYSIDWGDWLTDYGVGNGANQVVAHNYAVAMPREQRWVFDDPTELQRFQCQTNGLTGSIPDLAAYTSLTRFTCFTNLLTGSIPSLTANTLLTYFHCATNQLTGSIPSLAANTLLTYFACHANLLSGSIPELTNNTALATFYCVDNNLTGYTASTIAATCILFAITDNLLPESAVDQILADFETGVGARPAAGNISLGGTGNTAPSATGLASRTAILAAKPGWTITQNTTFGQFATSQAAQSTTVRVTAGGTYNVHWSDGTVDSEVGDGANQVIAHNYTAGLPLDQHWSMDDPTLLQWILCNGNALEGSIPSLTAYTALAIAYFNNNLLTGSIPCLTTNVALTAAVFHTNALTGYVASTIAAACVGFYAHNNLLTFAAVDQILADFATGVAGRPAVGTIRLDGAGNAAPSAAGVASRNAILAAKPGWTVDVN